MAVRVSEVGDVPWDDEIPFGYYGDFSMNQSFNPHTIIKTLKRRRTDLTPDFVSLRNDILVPVFVYGTLKKGFHNHDLLRDSVFLGTARTMVDYRMYVFPDGDVPLVRSQSHLPKSHRVHWAFQVEGEVYMVDPLLMLELDQLEQNGRMYERKKVWVQLLDQAKIEGRFPMFQPWMYLIKESYFEKVKEKVASYPEVHYQSGKVVYDFTKD